MRTTLDIDADVLAAVKERARRKHKTTGQVVSELLRQALTAAPAPASASLVLEASAVYGLTPFPSRGGIVTNALIDQLRHDDAY